MKYKFITLLSLLSLFILTATIHTAPIDPSEILRLKSNLLDTIKLETLNTPPTQEQKEQLLKTVNQLCKQFPTELLTKFSGIVEYYKRASESVAALQTAGPAKKLSELKKQLKQVEKDQKQVKQDKEKVLIEVLKPSFETFFTKDINPILEKMKTAIDNSDQKEFARGNIEYTTYMTMVIGILQKIAEKSPQGSTAKTIAEKITKEMNLKKNTIAGLRWNPTNKANLTNSLNGQIKYNKDLITDFNQWADKLLEYK